LESQTRKRVGTFGKHGNFKLEKHDFNAGVRRRWNRRTKVRPETSRTLKPPS